MSATSAARAFVASHALAPEGSWASGGGVLVVRGRVARFLRSGAEARRCGAAVEDLGPGLLLPGFVDAHAHLELSGYVGRVPPGRDFPAWIRALLALRGTLDARALDAAARAGAEQLLAGGTTLVGDIDTAGRLASVARGLPLRVRRFREALDARDTQRTQAALAALDPRPRSPSAWFEGLAPHAPYTVGPDLALALARRARARRLPVQIHWAETPEERAWLEHGTGPFAALLGPSPRIVGLVALEAAGLLTPRTSLVHGNDATPAERARVAASGAALVHCPGTHAFFARPRFDARAWRASGVTLALGTDSLASNTDLDLVREMALFRAAQPDFGPEETLALATREGARALGFAGRAGTLAPGAWADFALHATAEASAPAALDAVTSAAGRVAGVWVGGRRVRPGRPAGI